MTSIKTSLSKLVGVREFSSWGTQSQSLCLSSPSWKEGAFLFLFQNKKDLILA